MPYDDLYPFSRAANDLFMWLNDTQNLLMVCWKRNPIRYRDLTFKEVERIMKYINDEDRIKKEKQVCKYYESYCRLAHKNSSMDHEYTDAWEEAQEMNKVLNRMDKHEFRVLIRGKIWTDLPNSKISMVYTYYCYRENRKVFWQKFSQEHWVPPIFEGREWTMPMRALDWAKRVRKDEMIRCIHTTGLERMKWAKLAQKALETSNIPMR
ncbi:MAG: hypothetical protein Q9212_004076 [Teloschistes hypoglaucus]